MSTGFTVKRLATIVTSIIIFSSSICATRKRDQKQLPSTVQTKIVYSVENPAQLYLLKDGRKYLIADLNWIPESGYAWYQLKAVPKAELGALRSGADIRSPSVASLEGLLVKSPNRAEIYLVRDGLKHSIESPRWIEAHKYGAADMKIVPPEVINAIPTGAPFSYVPKQHLIITAALAVLVFCFLLLMTRYANGIRYLSAITREKHEEGLFVRVGLFAILTGCVLLRSVNLLLHPRFWAEEGVIWFQYALGHSVWSTLVFVYNLSGYLNLAANVAGVLAGLSARTGHMLRAPLVSTIVALIVQSIPFVILCFGNSRLFNSQWKRIVGGVILLVLPSATPEIWLNSINSMSFAGLVTLLLLFEHTDWRPAVRWLVRALLMLCGFTGIYAVVLAPFFFADYIYRRLRERAIQAVILLLVGITQAAAIIYYKLYGGLPMRGEAVARLAPINVAFYHVTMPFVGQDLARMLFRFVGMEDAWWVASSYPHWPAESTLLAGWISSLLVTVCLIWLCRRECSFDKLLLVGMFSTYSIITTLGSLHGIPAGRYAFLPAVALVLLVFSNIDTASYGIRHAVCCAAIAMSLAVGIGQFWNMEMFSGPSWRDEVVAWKKDQNYGLKVWPGGWGHPIYYHPNHR